MSVKSVMRDGQTDTQVNAQVPPNNKHPGTTPGPISQYPSYSDPRPSYIYKNQVGHNVLIPVAL